MSRFLHLALGVVGVTASSWGGALQWIQQHGEEVMDTTQHCVEAAQMAGQLQGKCGKLFDPEALASFAAWGLLEFLETVHKPLVQELMNSDLVRSAKQKAMAAVHHKTHDALGTFCGQPDCIAGLATFDKEYGVCYAGTLCGSLSSHLDYDKCKVAMQDFLPKMFRNQQHSMCAEDGHYYCSEEDSDLLMQNPECYIRFKMPAPESDTCPTQCVELWKKAEREHPTCMKTMAKQMKEQYELSVIMMKDLAMASKDPVRPNLPQRFVTFDEACLSPNSKRFVV